MRLTKSLSFRLVATYVALFLLSVGLLYLVAYGVSVSLPNRKVRAQVLAESDALAHRYVTDGRIALLRDLAARQAVAAPRIAFHAFILPDGTVASSNLPSWPQRSNSPWLSIEADVYASGDEDDHQALVYDRSLADGSRLLVGRDIEDIDDNEEILRDALAWLVSGSILLGIVGGVLMSRAIGRRIEQVNRAARQVIGGDLSGRVAIVGSGDDFDQLGITLNAMLARIEQLVQAVERVSDHVAHELRTPLARMMMTLDAATRARPDQQDALLQEASGEAAHLQRVFDTVLRIARIESGRVPLASADLDLAELACDAIELLTPAADEKEIGIRFSAATPCPVIGDRDALFQLLVNILDNAIRYSPEDGRVMVKAATGGGRSTLIIEDSGSGVADADLPRLTERFFRAAERQGDGTGGSGLGLSLADAIARQHGGDLIFANRAPGLRAALSLPGPDLIC